MNETETVKFYADTPNGEKNKLMNYPVRDVDHSVDLLNRFKDRGWYIRQAYHHFNDGTELSIGNKIINKKTNIEPEVPSKSKILRKTPSMRQ